MTLYRQSSMTPLERFEHLIRSTGADGHAGSDPGVTVPASLAWEILQLAKIGSEMTEQKSKIVPLRPEETR